MPIVRLALRASTTTVRLTVAALAPYGGQLHAKRNAWASMSTDAAHARARREAGQAFEEADAPGRQARRSVG